MSRKIAPTKIESDALFDRCVDVKLLSDGTIEVRCKLGLWSVSGKDGEYVRENAMHYWLQYYRDGEYDGMLNND